jgi:protein phosphatase
LFIVADGMGGHDRGEVASALAVRTVVAHLLENIYLPDLNRTHQGAALNELLTAALHKANFMVNEQVPEGGTTLTMALVLANSAYIAHVGDSRAYFFHQDGMKQITTDHSMAQRFKALGQEVPPEATNVLYQAIGHGSTVEVEVHVQHLPPGASLLLCSDGLWGAVDDDHIFQEVILQASTPQQACEALIALANENGGHDNITAIVILRGFEN